VLCALALCGLAGTTGQAAAAPGAVKPPTVKGKAKDGKTLKASPGRWSGAQSFTYSWERCDEAGEHCAAVGTGRTYLISDGDVGHRMRVLVTAEGPEGSASATSAPTAKIVPVAPKRKHVPTVSGSAVDGQVLSASPGSWQGTAPIVLSYQWESCGAGSCSAIPGATHTTYRAASADIGHTVRVTVTASNAAGGTAAKSKPSPRVAEGAPVPVGEPSVSGLPIVEQKLTAGPGEWAGTGPFNYSYQWLSCNLLEECEPISTATESTYTVGPLQIASSIAVEVTARNALGSASTRSKPTNLIKDLLPANLELPSITGLLRDGGLLSALLGSWSSHEQLSFSYVWELCDSAGLDCKEVAGTLGGTLGLISSMVGDTVRVVVTATNGTGSTSATSEPTSLVAALLPSYSELPSIGGLLQDGSSLLASLGSWTGTGPLSFSKVWELCDAAGESCKPIEGAAGDTLALISSMVGDTVRLAVTATNSAGSTTATSEPTSPIKALLPSNTKLPSILGELIDTRTLTGALGSWSGTSPSLSEQWELCNGKGEACKAIEGALGSTLGLLTGEIGSTVRLAVTASNAAGSVTSYSEPTSAIGALLPSNTKLPSIAGLVEDGQTLSGALGSWTGSAPSFSESWELCNGKGEACKAIEGALGSTLGLLSGMVGDTVRLAVTATNSAGSVKAFSEPTSSIQAILPKNTTAPAIEGALRIGQTIEALTGKWSGSEPIKYSYQWQLCGLGLSEKECTNLAGAVERLLKLELAWALGLTVRVVVTATNARGSQSAASPISLKILGLILTPDAGSTSGGTAVKLSGAEASKATAVQFGARRSTQIQVDSPDEITVTAPPASGEGAVPVTVSTAEGTTHETPEDVFTYEAP
jgi:hypothetical protein